MEMEKVKCDHCGKEIDKKDAIPCTWKEIDTTWYYCKPCNTGVFGMGIGKLKISNKKASEYLESMNTPKSFSIRGKSPDIAILDELYDIKNTNEIILNATTANYSNSDLLKHLNAFSVTSMIKKAVASHVDNMIQKALECHLIGHDWKKFEGSRVVQCSKCGVKATRAVAYEDIKNRR